jgi:hypothetical protein
MKKFELWEQLNQGYGESSKMLIPESDIELAIWADNCIYAKTADIEEYMKEDREESITEYFDDNDIKYEYLGEWATETELKEIEEAGNTLFDREIHEPFKSDEVDYTKIYSWWDGHNWKTISTDGSEDYVTASDDDYCLDEWDGRNWKTGTNFYHEYVRKIIDLNGEPSEDYLVIESSQYQGSHDTATVYTRAELIEHIEELGDRDINEYMTQIDAIEAK